ncbi:MAG: PAS domain S-box protein [Ginsengibacter sp.]
MVNISTSEFELFEFFEKTPDLVCLAGRDGFWKKVNPAIVSTLGYSEEELYARPIASFIFAEDVEITHKNRMKLLDGKVLHNFVNRYVTKAGKIIWLEWTSICLPGNGVVFAIAKDITERKNKEKQAEDKYNKFKSLATDFKNNNEKVRKNFAYELHEELAQMAAVIKMNVDWIALNTPGLSEPAKSRMNHASEISKLLIEKIQKISFAVSPNKLEFFGLNDTLEWLCTEFSVLNGIPCSFVSDYDEESLTLEMKIDFFRICQESLANAMTHAEAKNIMISIKEIDTAIQLTISDDGKGFDIDQQKKSPGLNNMKGRAATINAELILQSVIGKGTRVCVTVAAVSQHKLMPHQA